jgi:hypothetical protein
MLCAKRDGAEWPANNSDVEDRLGARRTPHVIASFLGKSSDRWVSELYNPLTYSSLAAGTHAGGERTRRTWFDRRAV